MLVCHDRVAQVGNGDVVSVAAARKLVQETGCGAIMVGRGAVTDPFLFWRIRASYERPDLPWEWDEPEAVQWFLRAYAASCLKAPAPASPVLLPNGQKQQQQQQQGELEAVLEEDGVSTSGRAPSDGLLLDGNLAMVGAVAHSRRTPVERGTSAGGLGLWGGFPVQRGRGGVGTSGTLRPAQHTQSALLCSAPLIHNTRFHTPLFTHHPDPQGPSSEVPFLPVSPVHAFPNL